MKKASIKVSGDISFFQKLEATTLLQDVSLFHADVEEILCHISDRKTEFSSALKISYNDGSYFLIHQIKPTLPRLISALIRTASYELVARRARVSGEKYGKVEFVM